VVTSSQQRSRPCFRAARPSASPQIFSQAGFFGRSRTALPNASRCGAPGAAGPPPAVLSRLASRTSSYDCSMTCGQRTKGSAVPRPVQRAVPTGLQGERAE